MEEAYVEHVELQLEQAFVSRMVDEGIFSNVDVRVEYMVEMMAYSATATVSFFERDLKEQNVSYPKDWKEAFKERWFPKWLLNKHPVIYTTVKINLKEWFPELKVERGNTRPRIVIQKSFGEINHVS